MRKYRLLTAKGEVILQVFMFIMLLLARDTLYTTSVFGFYVSQILLCITVVLLGLLFLVVKHRKFKRIIMDSRMLLFAFSAILILFPMLIKRDWQLMYFSILLCLLVPVFLTYFTDSKLIARFHVMQMTFLALYSLFATYILKPFVVSGFVPGLLAHNPIEKPLFYFGLSFVWAEPSYVRNFGIFREPGVYQFFLIQALWLNNYHVKWDKAWKLWVCNVILAITVVSTFSTNAIVELGLLVVILFIERKWYKDKKIMAIVAALSVVALFALVYSIQKKNMIYWTLYSMIDKLFHLTQSSGARMESIWANLKIFFTHPIVGASVQDTLYAVEHNTSSTLILFAMLGFGGGIFNLLAWILMVWDKGRHWALNLLLAITLLMSFNTQNLTADMFFWLFPVMIFTERILPYLDIIWPPKKLKRIT